jgi:hypothetical protein
MLPLTENFQSPDTTSNALAAVAVNIPAIAAPSLIAPLLLLCILPPSC